MEYRDTLSEWLGPEHTLLKLAAVGAAVLLMFLFFWPWPYKVAGTFRLKTADTAFIPAPFDGYLGNVPFREGDAVRGDEVILDLDQRELILEKQEIQAQLDKERNIGRVALSSSQLGDVMTSRADVEQILARLNMVERKIEQARIRAPFDGVIVSSDLHERIGKPIRKGEVLFRIAKLEGMFAEVSIPERDIENVRADAVGALAFASRPETKFPIRIERIHPAAQMVEEENVFIARVHIDAAPELWWRPGMTGVAKLRAGYRPPIWIITHKAVNQLRLKYLWF